MLSSIASFIAAIPVLDRWFNALVAAYYSRLTASINSGYSELKTKENAYLDAIAMAIKERNRDKVIHYRRLLANVRSE